MQRTKHLVDVLQRVQVLPEDDPVADVGLSVVGHLTERIVHDIARDVRTHRHASFDDCGPHFTECRFEIHLAFGKVGGEWDMLVFHVPHDLL